MPTASRSSSNRSAAKRSAGHAARGSSPVTLAPLIERLAALGTTDHWVVSCYLKLEPRDRTRGKYLIKLKNRIKNALADLERREGDRGGRGAVARDLDRIREHLEDPAHLPAGQGVALFACSPLDLFEVVPLAHVLRSRLVIDRSPLIRELAALNDEFGHLVCAVYDRTTARFFDVTARSVEERPPLDAGEVTRSGRFHGSAESERHKNPRNAMGRGVGGSAFGEHNFNMRIREEKQRHYAGIAQRLFDATRGTAVDGVVLAGLGKEVAAVEPHLHPYVREELLGTVKLNPKSATPSDVLAAVLELRRTKEREWEARHVAELREGLGTGWAVNGLPATLAALARGQVRTLLVDPETSEPGFRCAETGRLVVKAGDCAAEGDAVPVADVVDEAIEECFRQGGHVDVVEDDGAREAVAGLAALLRFALA